jgi:hypothetical protein
MTSIKAKGKHKPGMRCELQEEGGQIRVVVFDATGASVLRGLVLTWDKDRVPTLYSTIAHLMRTELD